MLFCPATVDWFTSYSNLGIYDFKKGLIGLRAKYLKYLGEFTYF